MRRPRTRRALLAKLLAIAWLLPASAALAQAHPSFLSFESGHVRPLALSPDGTQLFAVNTPDNRLEAPCRWAWSPWPWPPAATTRSGW